MRFCQLLPGFLSILRFLVLARELTLQAFQLLFGFAIVTRVLNGVVLAIGIVGFESHVNAHLFAGGSMRNRPLCLYSKLHIVPIGTMHNPYSLDLLWRKVCNLLFRIAN